MPRELVLESPGYRPQMAGLDVKHGTYIHICGTDIVRDDRGQFLVRHDDRRPRQRAPRWLTLPLWAGLFRARLMPQGNRARMMGTISAPARAATPQVIRELTALLGERVTTAQAVRDQHGRGEDYFLPVPPDAVCFARSTAEVSAVVETCARYGTPIIPFGAGTSVEGHVTAPLGGVSLDLTHMNTIRTVSTEDLDCRVDAGVTRKQLNAHLRDTGLFFPIDPGADASIGGMAATRASGTNAVRYGTMRDNVLGLTVVLADGRVITTGGRARKSAAGYDLTSLFIGSEGTLGVITDVQLRLYGVPETITSAVCQYPSLADAVNTVIAVIQMGVPVARLSAR